MILDFRGNITLGAETWYEKGKKKYCYSNSLVAVCFIHFYNPYAYRFENNAYHNSVKVTPVGFNNVFSGKKYSGIYIKTGERLSCQIDA